MVPIWAAVPPSLSLRLELVLRPDDFVPYGSFEVGDKETSRKTLQLMSHSSEYSDSPAQLSHCTGEASQSEGLPGIWDSVEGKLHV